MSILNGVAHEWWVEENVKGESGNAVSCKGQVHCEDNNDTVGVWEDRIGERKNEWKRCSLVECVNKCYIWVEHMLSEINFTPEVGKSSQESYYCQTSQSLVVSSLKPNILNISLLFHIPWLVPPSHVPSTLSNYHFLIQLSSFKWIQHPHQYSLLSHSWFLSHPTFLLTHSYSLKHTDVAHLSELPLASSPIRLAIATQTSCNLTIWLSLSNTHTQVYTHKHAYTHKHMRLSETIHTRLALILWAEFQETCLQQ